ncbi:MAG TPA: hypothetical protein VK587_00955 [bacterium]|nr:hypothetical protein [bacterium]
MPLPPFVSSPEVEALAEALFAPMLGRPLDVVAAEPQPEAAPAVPTPKRRRRRSGRANRPAAAAVPAPAAERADEPVDTPEEGDEEAWERTHLEQTMYELAREHAAAAERCAKASPPDRQCERTNALLAILMSYFALEAFISMVGTDRLAGRYRYYDRMTPEGKWVEVTRLAGKTGETFSESGREMRGLSTLRSWRNMLTHYKGEYEEVERSDRGGETRTEALLSAENAARAVEIARTMYRAFYDFDRRSAPRQLIWLNDRPYGPSARETERAPARTQPEPAAVKAPAPPAHRAVARRTKAPEAAPAAPVAPHPAPAAAVPSGTARRRRGRRRGRGGQATPKTETTP